jgi:2-alkenal reductase
MYDSIPPIEPKSTRARPRTALIAVAAATVILLSSCFLLAVGAVLFGLTNVSSAASRTEHIDHPVRAVAVNQATLPPPVVVEPPPDGIDYESAVLRNVYAQVGPSVVNITVDMEHPAVAGNDDIPGEITSSGSGFVWDADGHIVTNYHVVESADKVQVTFSDGTMSIADIVGQDEDSDLAVIKIDPEGYGLVPVRLGSMDDVYVGMRVAAIGNPFGLQGTLTSGIVSAIGRSIPAPTLGNYTIPDSIQTDAAINPGNSGGPLLNERGEVIGVNAQIRSEVRANSGVGFAIPVSILARVVPSLIEDGSYEHSYLGVRGETFSPICGPDLDLDPQQRGVLVAQVMDGGPAEQAGLRGADRRVATEFPSICPAIAGGDLVTAIDGQPVSSFEEMLTYMARYTSPGDTVQVTVLRGGEEQQFDLTLGTRPQR